MKVVGFSALGAAAGGTFSLIAGRDVLAVVVSAACFALLAAITVVDLRERRIPNRYTYGGTLFALAAAAIGGWQPLVLAMLGAVLALLIMGAFYIAGRGRLGMGDVKLSVFAGSILGLGGVLTFLFLGTVLGAAAAVVLLVRGQTRRATFAYGPYLAAGAAIALLLRGPIAG